MELVLVPKSVYATRDITIRWRKSACLFVATVARMATASALTFARARRGTLRTPLVSVSRSAAVDVAAENALHLNSALVQLDGPLMLLPRGVKHIATNPV